MNLTYSDYQISWHWKYISFLGPNFPGMRGTDSCFNVECVLLGHNFNFLGGYLVVVARCLLVTACYCLLLGVYLWLLLLTDGYCSLLLVTACSHF